MGIVVALRDSADGRERVLLGRNGRSEVDLALIADRPSTLPFPGHEGSDEPIRYAGRCSVSSGNEPSVRPLLLHTAGVLK